MQIRLPVDLPALSPRLAAFAFETTGDHQMTLRPESNFAVDWLPYALADQQGATVKQFSGFAEKLETNTYEKKQS